MILEILADAAPSNNVLIGFLVAVSCAFSALLLWIRSTLEKKLDDMRMAVDKNSALLVVLNEVQLARAFQSASTDEMKSIVQMVERHFKEAQK